ncbi:12753_t:CDS:2, partial [Rhizophagus irregularis]
GDIINEAEDEDFDEPKSVNLHKRKRKCTIQEYNNVFVRNSELNDYCKKLSDLQSHHIEEDSQRTKHGQHFNTTVALNLLSTIFEEHPNEELRSIARTLQSLKNKVLTASFAITAVISYVATPSRGLVAIHLKVTMIHHIKLHKDSDTVSKKNNKMITWNDNDGAIFCKYKRKSKSKTFNSIGFYYKMEGSMVGNDNGAPLLKKCSECSKNIARNKEEDNCLIHCNIGDGLNREIKNGNGRVRRGELFDMYVVELENFRNEMSNREKIDFNNYTLLKFLYQIIAEKNLRVEFICDVLEETSAFNVKIEAMKKDLIDNASTMSDISILWNNLLVDEFNLRGTYAAKAVRKFIRDQYKLRY